MPWVVGALAGLPAGATVLDLACGHGRHALHAARQGLTVLAVDRDPQALAAVRAHAAAARLDPRLETLVQDIENEPWQFAARRFDAIVVTNYLHRPRLDALTGLLAPGARLVYATFAVGNEQFGRPRHPDFLLAEGELLAFARGSGLVVVAYESGYTEVPAPAIVQRLVAWREGPSHTRPALLPVLHERTDPVS